MHAVNVVKFRWHTVMQYHDNGPVNLESVFTKYSKYTFLAVVTGYRYKHLERINSEHNVKLVKVASVAMGNRYRRLGQDGAEMGSGDTATTAGSPSPP